jgi:hypothetical protein
MSASDTLENGLLQHIFQNAAIANIGDAAGLLPAATAGSLYVALLTADPGEAGSTTNETTYTGYARIAVARSSAGWTVSGNVASNAALITFGKATAGTATITHFAIMTALTGGTMLFSGALASSLAVSANVQPEIAIGGLTITAD